MAWFEKPLLAVLEREYEKSMRFKESREQPPTTAPSGPCQLYVHVPFCEVLCPFCSFHRVRFQPTRTTRYFEALRAEIRRYHEAGFRFRDVYVGGGTPTVDLGELRATLGLVRSLSDVGSISVETNPNHLDRETLAALRDDGVTRLSVGVQSFDDGLLKAMDRHDKFGCAQVVRDRLAAAQGLFPTLNVDMIFNLPRQTLVMLDHDLSCLLELQVDQVSLYPLMTSHTADRHIAESMGRNDTSLRHVFYERILDRLQPTYRAASAWCFSRDEGMSDEYITEQQDYVGVGSGAFSLVDGAMSSTSFSLENYCRLVEAGHTGVTRRRVLGVKERMRYDFLVRLFGGELRRDEIERRHGRAFWLRMAPELAAMRLLGATRHDADAIRLTRRGMYCWMLMMSGFFNAVNTVREQMREHIRAEFDSWDDPGPAAGVISRASRPTVTPGT